MIHALEGRGARSCGIDGLPFSSQDFREVFDESMVVVHQQNVRLRLRSLVHGLRKAYRRDPGYAIDR